MSATTGVLEVLPGLARQAGRAQRLEVLVGDAGDLGALQQLAQQGAPAALRRADEVRDALDTEDGVSSSDSPSTSIGIDAPVA